MMGIYICTFISETVKKNYVIYISGMAEPAIVQGMYIFKQPGVGKQFFSIIIFVYFNPFILKILNS